VNFRSRTFGDISGQCRNITSPNSTALFCIAPSLPPGAYSVNLVNGRGEKSASIDVTASTFISQTLITSLGSFIGSLSGGNPLYINTNATVSSIGPFGKHITLKLYCPPHPSLQGSGLTTGFNTTAPDANIVTIGGLPCPIVNGSVTATSLACIPSTANGRVLAEYWNLSPNIWSYPDIAQISAAPPSLSRLESSVSLDWGNGSPGPSVGSDWFAARFTFYMAVPRQATYTFFGPTWGSYSMLYINDVLVGKWAWDASNGAARLLQVRDQSSTNQGNVVLVHTQSEGIRRLIARP